MIYKFSAKNFYSFKDFIEVSFEVNNNAPHTNAYVKASEDTRVSKVLSVIGPNASGKTNLLKILTFIHYLICHSYANLKPDEELPFSQYKFITGNRAISEIAVTFQHRETLFEYFIK